MARALLEVVLLGALGGIVGVYVLLRRLAFVADTMTHTVFPGVVLGFLAAGTGGVFWGALVAAVVTAVLLTLLTARELVSEDAALAVLLTGMFSVGVVLVSRRSSYSADLTAFLFGRILVVTREQIVQTAVVAVLTLLVLAVAGKELVLRSFDPVGARAAGYRVVGLDLVLNLLVALVIVAAVQAVGTILVIALLIVPAAAARALTDRLLWLAPIGAVVGAAGGWLGLAASYEASVGHGVRLASGATIVLALVALYLLALAALPARRAVARSRARRLPADTAPAAGVGH
ncbi:metal ABC transporter permease [Motilibacter aurantiacus]|uniref:metal ABC transporter permease n=1 Tax=Motilibacter aurantiacus TaxID=2714955 RepID=UPI0014089F20|nr:metal ABC transporter permease [Motilibacter aurantiacus]NHC44112.1 metal ABC transporter permease [Motilibacter aurantiacus]